MRAILALSLGLMAGPAFSEADPAAVAEIAQCLGNAAEVAFERACIGDQSDRCMQEPDGQTTVGMMFCMGDEADAWDVLLNAEYQAARATAKSMDENETANLKEFAVRADELRAAQRAWIAFRDANCRAAYGIYGSGSMRQISGAQCRLRMTAERTIELRMLYDIVR